MTVFSIDVTMSTHDLLRAGVTEATSDELLPGTDQVRHRHHRIVIDALDLTEAMLTAAQMAHTTHGRGMVTGTYWRF